jgi:hypothetical protein
MRTYALVYMAIGLALAPGGGSSPGGTGREATAGRIDRLIRQLGADDFEKREEATRELEAIGEPAVPALRKAAAGGALEARRRAVRALRAIQVRDGIFLGDGLFNWVGLIKEHWRYDGTALVGSTGPKGIAFNTFLCSKKTYRDFELSFKVRLTGGAGNSGVQVRSWLVIPRTFAVAGPQCDIGEGYWGCLYGELFGGMMREARREARDAVRAAGFNVYYIRCVGKRVTIRVNGETSVDEEFARLPEEGIIAFQLHGGAPMEVTFRDIRFKDLTRKK